MQTILQNETDRKKIFDALREISGAKTRIEAERDLIKEAINDLFDQYKIPKKTLNKMARVYHKQNFTEEQASNEEFEQLYETIVK